MKDFPSMHIVFEANLIAHNQEETWIRFSICYIHYRPLVFVVNILP